MTAPADLLAAAYAELNRLEAEANQDAVMRSEGGYPYLMLGVIADARAVLAEHEDLGGSPGYFDDDDGYGWRDDCCAQCGSFGDYGVEWPCPDVARVLNRYGKATK